MPAYPTSAISPVEFFAGSTKSTRRWRGMPARRTSSAVTANTKSFECVRTIVRTEAGTGFWLITLPTLAGSLTVTYDGTVAAAARKGPRRVVG